MNRRPLKYDRKAIAQYFAMVLFVSFFKFTPVCNFGKFCNFGLGSVLNESVNETHKSVNPNEETSCESAIA